VDSTTKDLGALSPAVTLRPQCPRIQKLRARSRSLAEPPLLPRTMKLTMAAQAPVCSKTTGRP
jgi:hypothetical protein